MTTDMPVKWNQWIHPDHIPDAGLLIQATYQYEKELIAATETQYDLRQLLLFKRDIESCSRVRRDNNYCKSVHSLESELEARYPLDVESHTPTDRSEDSMAQSAFAVSP